MTNMFLAAPCAASPPSVALFASHIPLTSLSGSALGGLPTDVTTYQSAVVLSQVAAALIIDTKTSILSYLDLRYLDLSLFLASSDLTGKPARDFTASRYRHQELEWRRTHGDVLRTFSGQWVVLERENIIAHGRDPVQVVREARIKGIQVPYIFYVETPTEDVAKMGL